MSDAPLPRVTIFLDAAAFRAWLEANHDRADELWIGYYKKGVPKAAMTYAEAVEEALCFGWIDGKARRIDDEVTGQRFTPRRKTSNWSAINIAKIAGLTAAGRMHPAGLRAFEERDRRKDASYSYEQPPAAFPPEWEARLRADPAAWRQWVGETPSYRRTATHWVISAKREETRERRLATLIADSAGGRRVKPFIAS
ncbi:MAG: YdeI/OmpD-associated family protein [Chloroflexota bacterium]